MCTPTPCTSSRARAQNRTNVQLWCTSPHECAPLQLAIVRFMTIRLEQYLSGLTPQPIRLTNQPTTNPHVPQKPAKASSHTDPNSERHHPLVLGLGHADAPPRTGTPGTQQHRTSDTAGVASKEAQPPHASPHPSGAAARTTTTPTPMLTTPEEFR